MKRYLTTCLALLAAALAHPAPALAFGADGHRIVADLAARQVAPQTARRIAALLGAEAQDGLPGIAMWADEMRELPEWRWTAPLHYVNFPRGECAYRPDRDCPGDRCVVAAIAGQARTLADTGRDAEVRLQALKFLVHFVADVHQPLHAGYADDRGGNTFQLFYLGQGGNLHALWDGGLLRADRSPWQARSARLAAASPDAATAWSARAPVAWAEESCRLIESAGVYPRRPGRLPRGYLATQLPVVERQLVLAGSRLAALLDAALAD